jgi:transcriptional regulator with XRE-family HTH domain
MDVNWIREQLAIAGKTQADLGDAIGLTSVQVNKILQGNRSLKSFEADKIRRFFGFSLPEERPSTLAVAGRVAAGDHLELVDDYARGEGMYHIVRPDWAPASGIVAAEVDGSSAEPWALPGDIIFWSRKALAVHQEDLGRPVVAETEDGRIMLKRLATGSRLGLWSLLSINPTHPNVMDVKLKWASRVLAPLPRDEVRIVD